MGQHQGQDFHSSYEDGTSECDEDNLREKKKLSLKHQVFQISCCADIISQMVAFAAEEIQSILNKTRALYNPKAQPLWYKPIDLAHEVIEMWSNGKLSSEDATANNDVPSDEEWEKFKEYFQLFNRIFEISRKLFEQKEECMTSNLYLYHLHEILSETSGTESFIGTVAKGMLEKLDKYWNNMFEMLAFAAVLDP